MKAMWHATWKRLGALLVPSWGRLGALLGPSWPILGPREAILGPSGGLFGLLEAILGSAWRHLGRFKSEITEVTKTYTNHWFCMFLAPEGGQDGAKLGPSWRKLGPSWAQVGILRRSCRHLAILARAGTVLEATWPNLSRQRGFLGSKPLQ